MTQHLKEEATAEWLDQPFNPNSADGWDRVNCGHHGLLKHLLVHEAGHAVAAARLNIEFLDVSIAPPGNRTEMGGGLLGGSLKLTRFENGWAVDCIDEAYEMFMMGVVAERKMLRHQLEDGYLQDVDRFLRAGNYLDGMPLEEFQLLRQRVMATVDENWPQTERDIRALIRVFAAQFTASGAKSMDGLTIPLLLTSAEVHSILDIDRPLQ
ncbi:hypothetical protein MB46_18685 [Arthrobacter alpinus]|uniref:hypothetical protein n=1 Tax=Arthrobacter alpinus TaxID=656366 RepID=UPI0005C95092|nr:hypothetical protein [Arthrobacter alpinus]ALV47219.1 hypothetical protein MB46_18685 [Arthrobacter alpinus]